MVRAAVAPKSDRNTRSASTCKKWSTNPILIIKTAWGGKSLHTDFRSPNAGPYEFSEQQLENLREQKKDIDQIKSERAEATGHYYRLMLEHVKKVLGDVKRVYPDYDADAGHELAGFVWFQGWNDMVDRGVYPNRDKPGGYDEYSKALSHFIRDVRSDLSAPNMPFVIGVMGSRWTHRKIWRRSTAIRRHSWRVFAMRWQPRPSYLNSKTT